MVAIKASVIERMMTKAMFGDDMTELILNSNGQELSIRTMDVGRSRLFAGKVIIGFPEGQWGISAGEKARDVVKAYKHREVSVTGSEAVLQITSKDKPKKQSKIPVEADISRIMNQCPIEFLMGPNEIMFYNHANGQVVNEVPTPCKYKLRAKEFLDALNAPVIKDAEAVRLKFAGGSFAIFGEDDAGFKEGYSLEGEAMMSPASGTTSKFQGLKDLAKVLEGEIILAMGQDSPLMVYEEHEGIIASYGVMPFLE